MKPADFAKRIISLISVSKQLLSEFAFDLLDLLLGEHCNRDSCAVEVVLIGF
jgi:hypothetical protein